MSLATTENKRDFRKNIPQTACFFFLALFMGIFLLQAMPVLAEQQKGNEDAAGEYTFGAGDVLEISVFGEPEISKAVFVRIDGKISLPLIGDVQAADTTATLLAQNISEKLTKFVGNPNVTVILAESKSKVYYVLGQIKIPGEFLITQPITVLQAIGRAGGLLEWAKKSKIMIVSKPGSSKKISYFDYDAFLAGENIGQNITINPGDTIVIP
jgi:polysaccharide export outer membrane protein